MKKPTRLDKLREAADLERYAAEALCRAARLRDEASAMRDEPRELAMWWLECCRRLRRAH